MTHHINPVIVDFGFLEIRWYGLLYLISFALGFWLLRKNFKYRNIEINKEDYETLIFDLCLAVVIGGRLGYIVFYNLDFYLHNPLHIFYVWQGGMSFHGGVIALSYTGWRFCRKYKYNFFQLADVTVPIVSIGLGLGRLGNFINGELYGKVTTLPWGIIFPGAGSQPRHPSQLYEMLLEGVVLFVITQQILKHSKKPGIVFWSWLLGYGVFRFLVEFIRLPDEQLGYIWGIVTMGQILSFFMIIAGILGILIPARKKQ